MVKVREFVERIEGYYGEYRPAVKPVVVQWIRSQQPTDTELSRLFAELIKTHTSQYRTPPDVAIMRPVLQQIQGETEHERLADLTRIALPDASEVVDHELQTRYWDAVICAMREQRDPADDETVTQVLQEMGVSYQTDA